ncbi:CLUMA_CG004021, isoform A [Clunio marinus]|uniref:CLUMA_CG004021, isoform A n=1 Tax=Clunio marinus TaxID=568069 RepID=A0A1J1HQR1_9DIPT|nr:CLUMA_CG004021, isoform A [Clunio marinus]
MKENQGRKANENNAQNSDKNKSKDSLKHSNDCPDQLDFSKIPLPDIPTRRKQLNKGKSLSKDSLPTSTSSKIQAKWKQLTDKEYFKKMHYRNSSLEKKPPSYFFGENTTITNKSKDGIFLNRSGWLQTNPDQRSEKGSESRKENIKKLKAVNSKIEELISRNEARKSTQPLTNPKDENVTILKIDPKTEPRQIANDRPGFLPVKSNLSHNGPPPTPILSPPPAFQDHKIRNRIIQMKNGTQIQLSVTDSDNKTSTANVGKGMVFSRSFEYDNRKTAEFNENFSRSFDFDFQLNEKSGMNKNFLSRYGKSTTFASLTGVSPNYLTKKPSADNSPSTSLTSIFPKVIPGNKVKMGNPNYYNSTYQSVDEGISRRTQFTRPGGMTNNYRSLESNTSSINNRLNSCDSGARSDFSNDDLDEDQNDDDEEASSSLALSYKSAATASSYLEPMKNTRNITKTLLNQQQTLNQQQSQFMKTRSMTPETSFDDYDLLTVNRMNMKKQRPITPEFLHKSSKLTTSQTSLMSRQSSGSRNSTLERQLKRYEEGRLSRSSSSSSEGGSGRRTTHRPPFKTTFGDYKIRRSRSLQLSERSPNRSQLQKLVVRIGNTPALQTTATTTTTPKHREKPDYVHIRSKTTLSMPSKYNSQNLRNSDNSLPTSTQTKSYEMLDFNNKSNIDYDYESDSKSKSFDDDLALNTKISRGGTRNVFSGNRAFSQDRVLMVPPTATKSLRSSPRNYGSRLYDHDILYDVNTRRAATRSPIMNFSSRMAVNPPLSRERSPISNRRGRDRERDNYKKPPTNSFLKPRTSLTPNRSPNRSPSDSDDSINESANKVLKDKSLVAEYLFGLKRKQQANRSSNLSGTGSSSGSCTSSSCEYWPQSGLSSVKYPPVEDKIFINGTQCKVKVHNDSDSSGKNLMKINVNTQRQKQQAYRGTTVTVNGGSSPSTFKHVRKPNNSSIIFLGDCEMPITKSATRKNSGSDSSANKICDTKSKDNNTQKIHITSRPNGELKQQFASSSQQIRAQNYNKGKFFIPTSTSVKRRHFTRLQSRSLPKSFMRSRYEILGI